ncbi:MAG: prepilin-type N-terminal cleavage/methylation domain-containing protein [Planctomycetota bacterium]|nr:prepilin-type N-terminal cleavage/methylation domain-containing protein [Planctomycetota bacterium]
MKDRHRYCRRAKACTDTAGFTLVELLVAMAVFSILGLVLAMFMSTTTEMFRVNSARRSAFSTASAVLSQMEADLVQAYLAPGDRNPDVDVRLRAFVDNSGNSRIAFVALSPNPGDSMADLGMREIGWYLDTSAGFPYTLRRNMSLAVGADDGVIETLDAPDSWPEFADMIGHFSVSFIPDTTSLVDEGITFSPQELEEGFPMWDSTRGLDPDFPLFRDNSEENPWDDILPVRAIITVTIIPENGMIAFITEDLDANGTNMKVNTTEGFPPPASPVESFLFSQREWMFYSALDDESFSVTERGARGTSPMPHSRSTRVVAGYSFVRTVALPCHGKAVR